MVWFDMPVKRKYIFCIWPRRLCRYVTKQDEQVEVIEVIGWVFMQKAHLEKNVTYGWISILDGNPYLDIHSIHNHPPVNP
jgi:hypothetical protein